MSGVVFGRKTAWGSAPRPAARKAVEKVVEEKAAEEKAAAAAAEKAKEPVEDVKLVVGDGAYQFKARDKSSPEARQKEARGVLNRMAPEKFEQLSQKLVTDPDVLSDEALLKETIDMIFSKAVQQRDLCGTFADLCFFLHGEQEKRDPDKAKVMKRLLLEMVQRRYDGIRGKTDDEVPKVQRLGCAQFVAELYSHGLLSTKVMHFIIGGIVYPEEVEGDDEAAKAERIANFKPIESDLELMMKLLATSGKLLDSTPTSQAQVTGYLSRLAALAATKGYSQRIKFLMLDAAELRENNWPDTNYRAKTIKEQEIIEQNKLEGVFANKTKHTNFTGEETAWGAAASIEGIKNNEANKEKPAQSKGKDASKPKNDTKKKNDNKKKKKK